MANREEKEEYSNAVAAIAIGIVVIGIGFPLWWKTTEVYRVSLPDSDIDSLFEKRVHYQVNLNIVVMETSTDSSLMNDFSSLIKNNLNNVDSTQHIYPHYKVVVRKQNQKEEVGYTKAKTVNELSKYVGGVSNAVGSYYVYILPKDCKMETGNGYISRRRSIFFKHQADLKSLIDPLSKLMRDLFVQETKLLHTFESNHVYFKLDADKASMRAVKSHAGYDVTFTLINPQPDMTDASWDIKGGINDYLKPFNDKLSDYISLNVKSQVIYYTSLIYRPHRKLVDNSTIHYYKPNDLPHLINPIEGELASHISTNPSLDFVVYVPTRSQSPLHMLDDSGSISKTNAFLSPRWGGIAIYNVPTVEGAPLPVPVDLDMKNIMEIFVYQLRLLLGVHATHSVEGYAFEELDNTQLAGWELDLWLRKRTIENIAISCSTLKSLSRLLGKIRNMVINDDIGEKVQQAVDSLQAAHPLLEEGNLRDAYLLSRQSLLSAEKAFFDPSLLELLYFPEDQKFAIYIPLFLPISVPVIMSMVNAFKWFKAKKVKKE